MVFLNCKFLLNTFFISLNTPKLKGPLKVIFPQPDLFITFHKLRIFPQWSLLGGSMFEVSLSPKFKEYLFSRNADHNQA